MTSAPRRTAVLLALALSCALAPAPAPSPTPTPEGADPLRARANPWRDSANVFRYDFGLRTTTPGGAEHLHV